MRVINIFKESRFAYKNHHINEENNSNIIEFEDKDNDVDDSNDRIRCMQNEDGKDSMENINKYSN